MDKLVAKGPLWADLSNDQDNRLSLPKAILLAALLELAIALLIAVNWREMFAKPEPPPMKVEFVTIHEPPPPKPEIEPIPEPQPPPPPPLPPKRELKKIVKKEPPLKPPPPPKPQEKPLPVPEPPPLAEPPPPEPPPPEPPPQPQPPPEPKVVPPPQPVKELPPVTPVDPAPPEPPPQQKKGKPIFKVRAVYPRSAIRDGIEGRVRLKLSVTEHGTVTNVEVIESKPPNVFDNSAIEAVRQYKFEPGDGAYQVYQTIEYKLEN